MHTYLPVLRCVALVFIIHVSYGQHEKQNVHGGLVRGNTMKKELALVFTGHAFAEGGETILKTLKKEDIKASFFFTGDFYRYPAFKDLISNIQKEGHYLGAHSDKHLLYCDWQKRDSLLVTKTEFLEDLKANYHEMHKSGINKEQTAYFLPPYEWYNDSISLWAGEQGLTLINFTSGTRSNADYTTPDMKNYRTSEEIFKSITDYETKDSHGLNGFILLLHTGVGPERTDKFYDHLAPLIGFLKRKGYVMLRIDQLLKK